MRHKPLALTVSILALASLTLATPAFAARPVAYSNKVKVVGNSVTIKTSGGVTVVQSSNSCSQGISGYLYQSIVVIFGGGTVVSTTQSTYCP
jgi:hypothetical protein